MTNPLVFTDVENIPDSMGCFVFKRNERTLYAGFTASTEQTFDWFNRVKEEQVAVNDLLTLADSFHLIEFDTMFEALLQYKIILEEEKPELNQSIKPFEQYQYLSLNFDQAPFMKVSDITTEDEFHVGPFYSRFLILDYVYLLSERYNLPNCDENDAENSDERNENFAKLSHLERIQVFDRYYIGDANEWIQDLIDENENYLNNLEFQKSEKIKTELRIVEQFRDFVTFLKVTKFLQGKINLGDAELTIKNGLLYSVTSEDETMFFGSQKDFEREYKKNEALAVDKSELNERRVIYRMIKEKQPSYIEKLREIQKG
jgi:excinuclease UvrABC nuclease subunit